MTPMPVVIRITLLLAGLLIAPCLGAQSDDYQDASRLFRSGQHAQALARVDGFLKSHPKDARARFLKGLILTEQNKPTDAIDIFTGLVEEYPELPEPYNNLAVLYASQGQYDMARTALEMSVRTHPGYATAYENLGDIYAKMASQAYDRALQLDKSNSAAQTKLKLINELFSSSTRPK
jgi:tetratricopeptide (TPR) repeat protein